MTGQLACLPWPYHAAWPRRLYHGQSKARSSLYCGGVLAQLCSSGGSDSFAYLPGLAGWTKHILCIGDQHIEPSEHMQDAHVSFFEFAVCRSSSDMLASWWAALVRGHVSPPESVTCEHGARHAWSYHRGKGLACRRQALARLHIAASPHTSIIATFTGHCRHPIIAWRCCIAAVELGLVCGIFSILLLLLRGRLGPVGCGR
jgi:hypothetical protein